MKLHWCLPIFLAMSFCAACASQQAEPTEKPKPGPLHWIGRHLPLPKFGGGEKGDAQWKGLDLKVILDPARPKLPEARQIRVTLQLVNRSKKLVQLDFPTTQRIDVLLKNSFGKVLERWSDDRAFAAETGVVAINPGERVEYSATVSTRDMVAGQQYALEAFMPQYEQLRAVKAIPTEK